MRTDGMWTIDRVDAQVIRAALDAKFGSSARDSDVVWMRTDGEWTVSDVEKSLAALWHLDYLIRRDLTRCLDPREFANPSILFTFWMMNSIGASIEFDTYLEGLRALRRHVWRVYGMLALHELERQEGEE